MSEYLGDDPRMPAAEPPVPEAETPPSSGLPAAPLPPGLPPGALSASPGFGQGEAPLPVPPFVGPEVLAGTTLWPKSDPAGLTPAADLGAPRVVARRGRPKGRRLVCRADPAFTPYTPEQRLLILDTWRRSGLPAGDFAPLVGLSAPTLYGWKAKFEALGPAGLLPQARGPHRGSRLPELTKRTILMLKEMHPEFGCQRISDLLLRGPALPASAGAVARVLKEEGYETEERVTIPHAEPVRRFERARPNELWQSDLFTFVLKRQNRRVWLVAFLDDHSRFVTGYGVHATASGALVLEVLRAAIASYGRPEEILTDQGSQYVTWRGQSHFAKELAQLGICHRIAKPRNPKTLGKIERFWGSLWRELLAGAIFLDLGDAQRRIGLFLDYYNFLRPHQGLGGVVPADRFFGAAPEVLRTLKEKVVPASLKLAREGVRPRPFYLTGRAGDQSFSIHTQGERVILSRAGQEPAEIDLSRPAPPEEGMAPPELPLSLCPEGRISGSGGGTSGEAEPLPPGVSWLDGEEPGLAAEPLEEQEGEQGGADDGGPA